MSEFSDYVKVGESDVKMLNPTTGRWVRVAPNATKSGKIVLAKWKNILSEQGGGGPNLLTDLPVAEVPDPDPTSQPWYHYHAPFAQEFGSYICLKKDTLEEIGALLKRIVK